MFDAPLNTVDDSLLRLLGSAIWSWDTCAAPSGVKCNSTDCFCQRCHQLKRYAQLFTGLVHEYTEQSYGPNAIFTNLGSLLRAIAELRSDLSITRTDFCSKLALRSGIHEKGIDQAQLRNAIALVVKLFTSIDCLPTQPPWHRLESRPYGGASWNAEVPFTKYIQEVFTLGNHHILSYPGSDLYVEVKSQLKATKLQKTLDIAFRPTHDIRNHLYFDRKDNVLEIFHHVAFLKEHLRCSKSASRSSAEDHSQPLPRQLLLEVLDSIQGILFPLSHARSKRLLQSLIQIHSLDPEMANFEFSAIRNPGEEEVAYVYLADRLSDLYNEMQNPRPRGWFEKQMEMRSGARYMMLATLVGVLFAVMLGFLALAVSCFQAWIAWQAWKHPVSPPAE